MTLPIFSIVDSKENCKDDKKKKKKLTAMDVEIVCQFFYLPYQHGDIVIKLIQDFSWLKDNFIDFDQQPHPDMVCFSIIIFNWSPLFAFVRKNIYYKIVQEFTFDKIVGYL